MNLGADPLWLRQTLGQRCQPVTAGGQSTLESVSLAALERVNAFWLIFRPEQTKMRGNRDMNAFSCAYRDESR
jgi:hypothetical protein